MTSHQGDTLVIDVGLGQDNTRKSRAITGLPSLFSPRPSIMFWHGSSIHVDTAAKNSCSVHSLPLELCLQPVHRHGRRVSTNSICSGKLCLGWSQCMSKGLLKTRVQNIQQWIPRVGWKQCTLGRSYPPGLKTSCITQDGPSSSRWLAGGSWPDSGGRTTLAWLKSPNETDLPSFITMCSAALSTACSNCSINIGWIN